MLTGSVKVWIEEDGSDNLISANKRNVFAHSIFCFLITGKEGKKKREKGLSELEIC